MCEMTEDEGAALMIRALNAATDFDLDATEAALCALAEGGWAPYFAAMIGWAGAVQTAAVQTGGKPIDRLTVVGEPGDDDDSRAHMLAFRVIACLGNDQIDTAVALFKAESEDVRTDAGIILLGMAAGAMRTLAAQS